MNHRHECFNVSYSRTLQITKCDIKVIMHLSSSFWRATMFGIIVGLLLFESMFKVV